MRHPADGNDRIQQRLAAVRETLAEEGRAIRPAHFAAMPMFSLAYGRQGFARILETPPYPTAILCTNDYLAAGAIVEARARGVAVPQEISIAGFDDIELAAHLDPPLTTVRVPDLEMGERAAQNIVTLLRGEAAPPSFEIEAPLIVRGSTGPPQSDLRGQASRIGGRLTQAPDWALERRAASRNAMPRQPSLTPGKSAAPPPASTGIRETGVKKGESLEIAFRRA